MVRRGATATRMYVGGRAVEFVGAGGSLLLLWRRLQMQTAACYGMASTTGCRFVYRACSRFLPGGASDACGIAPRRPPPPVSRSTLSGPSPPCDTRSTRAHRMARRMKSRGGLAARVSGSGIEEVTAACERRATTGSARGPDLARAFLRTAQLVSGGDKQTNNTVRSGLRGHVTGAKAAI